MCNMVTYQDHQVYFERSGSIHLFNKSTRLLTPDEKFMGMQTVGDFTIVNSARCVNTWENELYFLNYKGNVNRFDMNLLIRSSHNRRTYNAEDIKVGPLVDFAVCGKYKLICLSLAGVVTVVEFSRVVRQTAPLSESDQYTLIKEYDEKILAVCYSERYRRTTFRLLGPDLRDMDKMEILAVGRSG